MESSNIIVTLIARSETAIRAFRAASNSDRYIPPEEGHHSPQGAQESTPNVDSRARGANAQHRIQLTFDSPPKNPEKGFVFGVGENADINLRGSADEEYTNVSLLQSLSRRHFAVTFDSEYRLIVQGLSKTGTAVTYHPDERPESRTRFTWILFPERQRMAIHIPPAEFEMAVELSVHDTSSVAYRHKINQLIPQAVRERNTSMALGFERLSIQSELSSYATTAPSQGEPLRTGPIFFTRDPLGYGDNYHADVEEIVEVSSEYVYAAKFFHEYVSEAQIEREASMLQTLHHQNIARFHHRTMDPPSIFMELVPGRSLKEWGHEEQLSRVQVCELLRQSLIALEYMEEKGVVHRDLTRENIVAACEDPVLIKFVGFGLAESIQERSNRTMSDELDEFAAPEVTLNGEDYTHKADVWAIGIVAAELLDLMPSKNVIGLAFYNAFEEHLAAEGKSDPLAKFLSRHILVRDPNLRLSARECLEELLTVRDEVATSPERSSSPA